MKRSIILNLYSSYIALLKTAPQAFPDYAEHAQHMRAILTHLSRYKGGRSLPCCEDVVELCKLKKLCDEHEKSNSKFQLLQRLVPHLITEIQKHDHSYVPPRARTNNAMILFPQRVCATINEPAVVPPQVSITITERKTSHAQVCAPAKEPKNRLTGVKNFKSMQEYRAFVRVGQHPMHASPCVCVTGLQCANELVFEEWSHHKKNANDSVRQYLCRRRRRPHRRKRELKTTEDNHSEESKQKQVKSIAKNKKGLSSVKHVTAHTTVNTA